MSLPLSQAAVKPQQRSFWIAVICGAVVLTIGKARAKAHLPSFRLHQRRVA